MKSFLFLDQNHLEQKIGIAVKNQNIVIQKKNQKRNQVDHNQMMNVMIVDIVVIVVKEVVVVNIINEKMIAMIVVQHHRVINVSGMMINYVDFVN